MKEAVSLGQPAPGRCLRLSAVDWQTYSRLLRAFAERPGVRLTYDRGELEIMSPLMGHDRDGRFLGRLVNVLAEAFGLPVIAGGSVTLRRRRRQRGIEGDESFWIANAHRVAGRQRLDLRTDPPPDLAIEVDVTHSSMDRLAIYAALKVPEVWRLDGDVLTFHVLAADGRYESPGPSRLFPLITPEDILPFLLQARQAVDQNAVVRQFQEWLRRRLAAGATGETAP